jgi:ketosteroid isomerase-like protein
LFGDTQPVSAQNLDVVRRIYAAWSRDEFPGPTDLMDPDIEYVNPAGAVEPGIRTGLPAFTKILDAWEFWRAEPECLEPVDDQVVAVVRYRARGRGSGVEVQGLESAVWTLRDGKVIRYEWFYGPDDAFKAVGLEAGDQ